MRTRLAGAIAVALLGGCGARDDRAAGGRASGAPMPGRAASVTVALPGEPGGATVGRSVTTPIEGDGALRTALAATVTPRGTLVALPADITFASGRTTIRPDARPTLDRLAALIKAEAASRVLIEGHTDSRGDDRANQALSQARATAVRDYLIAVRTVDGTRLATRGWGELRPVAPDRMADGRDDPAGRARNRRVEVILVR